MRMYDLILKKRKGEELTTKEIEFMVEGYTDGLIPDYQMSAFMMAVIFQHLSKRETCDLTMAMAHSGDMLDLSNIEGIKVDKHSTGGVGDKTSLVVAPMVAACGVPVAKMSGRGLGHTGGTIDKLESFDGFSVALSEDKFINNVNTIKIAIAGQTANLAPADKKLYALRDVTATVDNLSLIAASIMSKKLASGSNGIVLDVKVGSGAFMKDEESAFDLAKEMVDIGNSAGRQTIAIISNMDQPLGNEVGNANEVREAIDTLSGKGPDDLKQLCLELGSNMLLIAGKVQSVEEGKKLLQETIDSGKALDKLKQFVEAQGGNRDMVDDYSLLPSAKNKQEVTVDQDGYVKSIKTEDIGIAAMLLGAGRETKESIIDLGVGLTIHKKVGDKVSRGESIVTISYNSDSKLSDAENIIKNAYTITEEAIDKPKIIKGIVTKDELNKY